MNCLAWNCQGLGGSLTVRNLGFHIREYNPRIIFLSETKAKGRKIEFLKQQFNLNGIGVDARGKSGGLALLWRKDIQVDLQSFSVNHIDAFVYVENDPVGWRFTGFYGEPDSSRRHKSWNLIRRLSALSNKPWICAGDYNALLSQSDKEGGNRIPSYQLREFREALYDSGLLDLGFSGSSFTWSNGWEFPRTVSERLDRACANDSWITKFPYSLVEHLKFGGSDHCPILIRVLDKEIPKQRKKKRRFMFESMWFNSNDCSKVVNNAWNESVTVTQTGGNFLDRFRICQKELEAWSSSSFGNVLRRINYLREKIHSLRTGTITSTSKAKESNFAVELEELLDREEKMWQQRAKAHWMKDGDRNTRFFHSKASGRRKKNEISGIRREDGLWCNSDLEIEREVVNYFQNIFTSSHPSTDDLNLVVGALRTKVSFEDNQHLLQPYSAEEVRRALFSMYPLKSPGPDGFPPIFFHKYWNIIGKDVTCWVLDFLNRGKFDENCNFTNVALIPKCDKPEFMTQFRPISLCNVIYKIASKAIANRLKPIMNAVISDTQSAFVPGRQITDNVLVAFETTHYMKNKTRGGVGDMAIKLDMSKAYDRVEWDFLRAVMIKLGFDVRFVNLVMTCVTSVTYSFLLNGYEFGFVKPERGIRQGDPLSPYLFLFCAESLSSLITLEEDRGNMCGIAICQGAPNVSHLLFADDTMIFCEATIEAAVSIRHLLHIFGLASGQRINFEKSSVVFTRNTQREIISDIMDVLPVRLEQKHNLYLGLPLLIGRSKGEVFDFIRDRVWKRIQSLKSKSLSRAGREVMIKSVLQAIPSYLMSCFKLPGYLIHELEAMVSKFWWNEKDSSKIHWVKWDTLCDSKRDGGMGFRDLDSFNTALLAKQAWRLLLNPDTLLGKILKARYFPTCDLLEANVGSRPSITWRSIWGSLHILHSGLRWRVGDGNSINIWGDKWLPRSNNFLVSSPPRFVIGDSKVSSLIDATTGSWNIDLVKEIFWEDEAKIILSIPLGNLRYTDCLMWHFERSGRFSVKSAYRLCRFIKSAEVEARFGGTSGIHSRNWDWIWKIFAPPKVRHFIWSCCFNAVPFRYALHHRKLISDPSCPRCSDGPETLLHCLFACPYARQVWALSDIPYASYYPTSEEAENWFSQVRSKLDSQEFGLFSIICWWLWFSRNKFFWEALDLEPLFLVQSIRSFFHRFSISKSRDSIPSPVRTAARWCPPPQGYVKINFDAAILNYEAGVGLGYLARDSNGVCVKWGTKLICLPLSPEAAEATAALHAVVFGVEAGWTNIILESDCLSVVEGISSKEPSMGDLGPIFEEIKLISKGFDIFRVNHAFRECNRAAHSLAKLASREFFSCLSLPVSVSDIVNSDIV